MREIQVERALVKKVKGLGGMCLKFNSLSMSGIPDRIILMGDGKVGFVEVKRKGKKPRPLQIKRIKDITKLGFKCFVLDDINMIGEIIDEIRA